MDMRIVSFHSRIRQRKGNAINRALELLRQNRQVTIVDLDTVEPLYNGPLRKSWSNGLRVMPGTRRNNRPWQKPALINQQMIWACATRAILSWTSGMAHGARILNLVEGRRMTSLRLLVVVNIARPMMLLWRISSVCPRIGSAWSDK